MKRAIAPSSKRPKAWDGFEYAALHNLCADDIEDRISELNIDSEDVRAEVESILQRMNSIES